MSLKSRKLQDCLLTFRPNVNLASAFSFQQILVASPRLTSHRLAEHKGNNFTSPRNLSCCSNKSISLRRPSIKAESLHSCTTWNKLVLNHQVFTENLVEIFDFPRFRFTIADSLSARLRKFRIFPPNYNGKFLHATVSRKKMRIFFKSSYLGQQVYKNKKFITLSMISIAS